MYLHDTIIYVLIVHIQSKSTIAVTEENLHFMKFFLEI